MRKVYRNVLRVLTNMTMTIHYITRANKFEFTQEYAHPNQHIGGGVVTAMEIFYSKTFKPYFLILRPIEKKLSEGKKLLIGFWGES